MVSHDYELTLVTRSIGQICMIRLACKCLPISVQLLIETSSFLLVKMLYMYFETVNNVQRGIKVWARAEATNGYVSAFQVYTSKQGDTTETGLGAKFVKNLTEDLVELLTSANS